ncbi:hypothetical protein BaRGS_00017005 [Batillaria attramentaria]|uniref:Uncharacterized protein n=1 Tax=Batillaria attramentaria TaxID=370345 RepID=A0ABD0KX66_9CAEN
MAEMIAPFALGVDCHVWLGERTSKKGKNKGRGRRFQQFITVYGSEVIVAEIQQLNISRPVTNAATMEPAYKPNLEPNTATVKQKTKLIDQMTKQLTGSPAYPQPTS